MSTYILKLPAAEVVRLLRAETVSAHGAPELNVSANKDYLIEEEFDSKAYGIEFGDPFDLVTSVATLSIEPRVESGYWILAASVERLIGPVHISSEGQFGFKELSLDEFETELDAPGNKRVTTKLHVQTPEVRQEFACWLEQMRIRHRNSATRG